MTTPRSLGQVQITFECSRHLGPNFIHGGVTLVFDSLLPYAFASEVTWPTSDNYENAIREAVEGVLLEKLGNLNFTRVVLRKISWHKVDSCELGFRRAARAATLAALEV
jgi:hypothetical protein